MSEKWQYALAAAVGGFFGALLAGWATKLWLGEGYVAFGPLTIFRSRDGDIGPGRSWVCWHWVKDEGLWMYNAETLAALARDAWRNWKKDNSLVG